MPPDAKSQDLSNGDAKTDIRDYMSTYKLTFIKEGKHERIHTCAG